ncbi:MAG: hypothetical protein J6T82_06230 [Bacteroidaceae bacterium]|nr:hypothetical protein [Bacteroidaceae bacterium]
METEKLTMSEAVFQTESFLNENYEFRRNVLNGKTEMKPTKTEDAKWGIMTDVILNSIILRAKKAEIGGNLVQGIIQQIVHSESIPEWNPVVYYLEHLPVWDKQNHVAKLFERIPGLTSEQLSWCSTWLRSAVAHWMDIDRLHGNESVPILIGKQGCGKSTFAVRLLPPELREYYLQKLSRQPVVEADYKK